MQQKYFTKYLPRTKQQNLFFSEFLKQEYLFYNGKLYKHYSILNNKDQEKYTFIMEPNEKTGKHVLIEECSIVDLFLCTKFIEKGDKVFYEDHPHFGEKVVVEIEVNDKLITLDDGGKTHDHNLLKVLGQISPAALSYVKEGQEFKESDFSIKEECPHYNGKHMWKDCSCKTGFINGIYIKDSCGHFH